LCETAFVARGGEGAPGDGDLDALAVRWPGWHARLANFLMGDPLHGIRMQLQQRHDAMDAAYPQADLFPRADAADAPGGDGTQAP
jgi:hypothetical protein